jgi:hypothetical protein
MGVGRRADDDGIHVAGANGLIQPDGLRSKLGGHRIGGGGVGIADIGQCHTRTLGF